MKPATIEPRFPCVANEEGPRGSHPGQCGKYGIRRREFESRRDPFCRDLNPCLQGRRSGPAELSVQFKLDSPFCRPSQQTT